jgi:hypothetical protein
MGGWSAGSITAFRVGYSPEYTGDNTDNDGAPHTIAAVIGLDGIAASGIERDEPPFVLFRAAQRPPDDPDAVKKLVARAEEAGLTYEVHVIRKSAHRHLIRPPFNRQIVALAAPFLRRNLAGCR